MPDEVGGDRRGDHDDDAGLGQPGGDLVDRPRTEVADRHDAAGPDRGGGGVRDEEPADRHTR